MFSNDDDNPFLRSLLLSLKLVALGIALCIVAEVMIQKAMDAPRGVTPDPSESAAAQ